MVQVREHGQGQILVEYKRGSELNKRMCSFVLMHVQIVLLPGSLHHSPVPAHYVMVYQAMGIGMRSWGGVKPWETPPGDKWVEVPMTRSWRRKIILWDIFRPQTWPFWDLKALQMVICGWNTVASLLWKALRSNVFSQNCIFSTQRSKSLQVTTKQEITSKHVLAGEVQSHSQMGLGGNIHQHIELIILPLLFGCHILEGV